MEFKTAFQHWRTARLNTFFAVFEFCLRFLCLCFFECAGRRYSNARNNMWFNTLLHVFHVRTMTNLPRIPDLILHLFRLMSLLLRRRGVGHAFPKLFTVRNEMWRQFHRVLRGRSNYYRVVCALEHQRSHPVSQHCVMTEVRKRCPEQ